jgi:hypothetical protein
MTKNATPLTKTFLIADHYVRIVFMNPDINNMWFIRSFTPFETNEEPNCLTLNMVVDDGLVPKRENREKIGEFDSGNGKIIIDRLPQDHYQFIIKNTSGYDCSMLQANHDFTECYCALNGNYAMRCYGLNNALMLAYAFAGCWNDTLMVHASLVRHNNFGYAFIAKSGTGKSTQVSSWLRYIPNCDLMNDDNPIIRIIDGKAYIYGSPWSGKTPCYRQVKAPLGAITRINRAEENCIEQLQPVEAFASFLPSCSTMKWDSAIFNNICDAVTKIVENIPVYTLHCLPDKEAALLCHKTISR